MQMSNKKQGNKGRTTPSKQEGPHTRRIVSPRSTSSVIYSAGRLTTQLDNAGSCFSVRFSRFTHSYININWFLPCLNCNCCHSNMPEEINAGGNEESIKTRLLNTPPIPHQGYILRTMSVKTSVYDSCIKHTYCSINMSKTYIAVL